MTTATDDITCVCCPMPVCPHCQTYGYLTLTIEHLSNHIVTDISGWVIGFCDAPAVEVAREIRCGKCGMSSTEEAVLAAARDWVDRMNEVGGTCMVPERVSDCGGAT